MQNQASYHTHTYYEWCTWYIAQYTEYATWVENMRDQNFRLGFFEDK